MEVRSRMRTACKRWSAEDKLLLLDLVKEDLILYEKPTARIFYNKLIGEHPQFAIYGWKALRDKMRNLRLNYIKAIDWRHNTGSGIYDEKTIRDHMLRICEDFDILDVIFGSKQNIQPMCVYDSTPEESAIKCEPDETSIFVESPIPSVPKRKRTESSSSSSSSVLTQIQGGKAEFSVKKLAAQMDVEHRKLKLTSQIQRRQTEFLEKKLAAEMDVEGRILKVEEDKFQLQLRRMALEEERLKSEMRLKELEIEKNFEINIYRIDKEMELKQMEIKLKYKQ